MKREKGRKAEGDESSGRAQRPFGSSSCNNTPPGIDAMLNFNINYKYLSAQQGNNLTITLAPSTVLNAKWG